MIGILGGTFDPVHYGHLRTALDVAEALSLSQVRFLPLGQAVHRQQPQATAEQRLAMLRLAIARQPRFVLDETEVRRDGPSYMVDTLRELRVHLGDDQPLCLLLGQDAFSGFMLWREPEAVAELCHLVVMMRPGSKGSDSIDRSGDQSSLTPLILKDATDLMTKPGGGVWFQSVTQLAISSTDIRRRTAVGLGLDYLLPTAVADYIRENRLYIIDGASPAAL